MSTISTAPDAVAEENAVEAAKRLAARRAVADHFRPEFMHVGIGSGSTIKYVVEAIADALAAHHGPAADLALATTSGDAVPLAQRRRRASSTHGAYGIAFVPTGYQSRETIVEAGLHPVALDALEDAVRLDVAFDGADEVDAHLNCIKGGGACLFQEKLVAMRARKWICVADYRKAQQVLLTAWPSIPIEVAPIAAPTVLTKLRNMGSVDPRVRLNPLSKSGPLRTDQGFYIVDAPFPGRLTEGANDVPAFAADIRGIVGVLEVGLFCNMDAYEAAASGVSKTAEVGDKPVAAYFGMKDGTVQVRVSPHLPKDPDLR